MTRHVQRVNSIYKHTGKKLFFFQIFLSSVYYKFMKYFIICQKCVTFSKGVVVEKFFTSSYNTTFFSRICYHFFFSYIYMRMLMSSPTE